MIEGRVIREIYRNGSRRLGLAVFFSFRKAMLSKARPDQQAVLFIVSLQLRILDYQHFTAVHREHHMFACHEFNAGKSQFHPPGRPGHTVSHHTHINAALRGLHVHIDLHIRPQFFLPAALIHLPPIAGFRLLFERQIIPALHGLVQMSRPVGQDFHRLRLKRPMLTEASRDLHLQLAGSVMEIKEIGFLPHYRVAVMPLPGPQDSGIFVKPGKIRLFVTTLVFKAAVFGVQHQINQALRGWYLLFLYDIKNRIAHPQEFRDVIFHAHSQVLHIITQRIHQPVLVKTGGIGSKNTSVRLPVGEHHMQVPDGMLLVLGISEGIGKHQHGIVIYTVIITGGFLREFPVLITVAPFFQIDFSGFRQFFISEKHPAFCQRGGDGPTVVGGMEAALQQAICTVMHNFPHLPKEILFLSGTILLLAQILIQRDKKADAESRIRRGEKIAGNIIKEAVFMLYTADIRKAQLRPLCQQGAAVIPAVRIAVQSNHGFHADNGILGLNDPVPVIKASVPGALLIQFLDPQTAEYPILGVLQYFLIMFFHKFCPFLSCCQALPLP